MTADIPQPEIVGVSDINPAARQWFCDNFDTVKYSTADYTELLAKDDIDAVYCAVPHNLHEKIYVDIINAGKHLLGEKPFGIDAEANKVIMDAIKAHPEVIVRCSSEFPYYPACQKLIEWIREGKFGKIIEVRSAFCHSSDMDTQKPINWKRTLSINGEYGCMGDLGIHTEHVPFRMGWKPLNVFAKLSNIVTERPDGKGNIVPCETWDNAILLCDVKDVDGSIFPMMYETKRLSPGSTNEWRLEVYGLEASAKFSTNDPGAFCYTQSLGKEQAWCRVNVGYKPMIPTLTGGIFEFGFTDSILQMWGAFMCELSGIEVPFGCVTPEETELSHKLQTAALLSNKTGRLVTIE
jgi:predicted dehydrogenase